MRTVVCLFCSVLVGFAAASKFLHCPRYSPQELWYGDYLPWLNSSLLELKIYFKLIHSRVGGKNLLTLMPHVSEDSDKAKNLAEGLDNLLETSLERIEESFTIIERAWLPLFELTEMLEDSPVTYSEALDRFEFLRRENIRSNELHHAIAKDWVMLMNQLLGEAMEGIAQIIENSQVTESEEALGRADAAKLMVKKISQVAPGHYLGGLMIRILERALKTNAPRKSEPFFLIDFVNDMEQYVKDFGEMFQDQIINDENWETFWEKMFQKSIENALKHQPTSEEQYHRLFRNEVFITEMMMNLLAYY